MKKTGLRKKQKKALAVLGTTAGVYLALKYVLRLFFPFLLSWWLAVLVGPAAVFLEQKTCVKRTVWASLFITALSAVLAFSGLYPGEAVSGTAHKSSGTSAHHGLRSFAAGWMVSAGIVTGFSDFPAERPWNLWNPGDKGFWKLRSDRLERIS